MNHAIEVLKHEKNMLEKILKPYRYNISKGFYVPITDKYETYETKLKEVNNAIRLIKVNA